MGTDRPRGYESQLASAGGAVMDDLGFWMGLAIGLVSGLVLCVVVHILAGRHWSAQINAGRAQWRDKFADMAAHAVSQGSELRITINPKNGEDDDGSEGRFEAPYEDDD